jgi:hypothetical protein
LDDFLLQRRDAQLNRRGFSFHLDIVAQMSIQCELR